MSKSGSRSIIAVALLAGLIAGFSQVDSHVLGSNANKTGGTAAKAMRKTIAPVMVKAVCQRLSSYEEAREKASFPIKVPDEQMLGNLKLAFIDYYTVPNPRGSGIVQDFVLFLYTPAGELKEGESFLELTQMPSSCHQCQPPDKHNLWLHLPEDAEHGKVVVQGVVAQWIKGTWVTSNPKPGVPVWKDPDARWVAGKLTLRWTKDGVHYCLSGKGVSLEDMIALANSLH